MDAIVLELSLVLDRPHIGYAGDADSERDRGHFFYCRLFESPRND